MKRRHFIEAGIGGMVALSVAPGISRAQSAPANPPSARGIIGQVGDHPGSGQGVVKVGSEIQAALEKWVAERAGPEKITGVAAYISFGDPGPAIEAFAGKVGDDPRDPPVRRSTLFQTGSTSKSFAVAVILKLEAAGALSLNDTIGKWLPQYPAWKDVSLRHLLNMTSGIPNYSETETLSHIWVREPSREVTAAELVQAAYPTATNHLPPNSGYYYSNTNYVLASMIAAKAEAYLRDVLGRIADHPINRIAELLPWNIDPPRARAAA